jgi:ribosomal protein L31
MNNGIHVKKKMQLMLESTIDDTMVTNSTTMTTYMLPFSTLLLDFYYMPKISPSHTCLFLNVVHTHAILN